MEPPFDQHRTDRLAFTILEDMPGATAHFKVVNPIILTYDMRSDFVLVRDFTIRAAAEMQLAINMEHTFASQVVSLVYMLHPDEIFPYN